MKFNKTKVHKYAVQTVIFRVSHTIKADGMLLNSEMVINVCLVHGVSNTTNCLLTKLGGGGVSGAPWVGSMELPGPG